MTAALSDGRIVEAVKAVLALGNPASAPFESASIQLTGERRHVSPWIGAALRVRFVGERVFQVGAGLTAVDPAPALHGKALTCKTYMISRRGILPRTPGSPPVFEEPGNIRKMFGQLRAQIGRLREANGCWRTAADAFAPRVERNVASNAIGGSEPFSAASEDLLGDAPASHGAPGTAPDG